MGLLDHNKTVGLLSLVTPREGAGEGPLIGRDSAITSVFQLLSMRLPRVLILARPGFEVA